MAIHPGHFEGTWTVVRGLRKGSRLVVEKSGEAQYKLSQEGGGVLYPELNVDSIAFTIENETACISLFWDCEHLFGIEQINGSYKVWGAVRNEEGAKFESPLLPKEPSWRLGKRWIVKARTGHPPVRYDDKVVIRENSSVQPLPYKIGVEGSDPFDEVLPNGINRTLDSAIRTVATWRRGMSPGKRFIFGMVILPESVQAEIEPYLADVEKVKEILRNSKSYLPFEVKMLVEGLAGKSQSSIGVWGAEEG